MSRGPWPFAGAAAALAAAALAAAAAAAPAAEKVVRVPFPQDDGSLTPYTFELGYPLVTLIYDTLTWRDERGAPEPWLARSVQRAADPRRVVVRLRHGVRWHDGRPLTARDVVFTFRWVARRFHPRFTPQVRDIAAVTARRADTVVFRLRRPSLGFEDQPLADVPILPEHLWRDLPPGRLAPPGPPVGSGPYRLEAHERGRSYRFRANADHFRGTPLAEQIEVPVVRFPDRTLAALRGRRVDALPVSLPPDVADGIESLGVRVLRGPSYLGTALLLNTRRPPFDDQAVRRAVAGALDLTRMARALSDVPGERGAAPADYGWVHPDSRWAPERPLHRFEPDAARVAIVERRVPTIRILAPRNDPVRLEAARQVALALGRVQARAEVVELEADALARAVGQDGHRADFEAAIWPIPPLASHDPSFLRALFGPPGEEPLNRSGHRSAAIDAALDAVSAAATAKRRRDAVARLLERLAREAPAIPLFFADGVFAYRPATYDRWVFVRGTGILDKRSFLPGPRGRGAVPPRRPAAQAPREGGDPLDRTARDDGFRLGPFGLAAVFLVLAAAGFQLAGRLRRHG